MPPCVQPHQRGTTLLQPSRSWQMTALLARANSSESSTEAATLGETEVAALGETEVATLGEAVTEEKVDPYELVKEDILALSDNIKTVINTGIPSSLSYTLKLKFH